MIYTVSKSLYTETTKQAIAGKEWRHVKICRRMALPTQSSDWQRQSFFCRFTSARLPSKTSVTAAASCKETPGAEGCWPPAFWEVQHSMIWILDWQKRTKKEHAMAYQVHITAQKSKVWHMTYAKIHKTTTYVGSVPSCSESSLASREHLIQQHWLYRFQPDSS